MTEIKPCPFCGGTDMLVETYPLGEKYRTGIVCRSCLGGMDTMKSYPTSDEARSKAEEAWNRRTEPHIPFSILQRACKHRCLSMDRYGGDTELHPTCHHTVYTNSWGECSEDKCPFIKEDRKNYGSW